MTRLAQLVHTSSHYLSLKLPAEITPPHRGYPIPTISPPSSSYSSPDVQIPGSTQSKSSHSSPAASRSNEDQSLSRPRPLSLEKKLSILAKDSPVSYASFVEGVSLLAWDIAWLCKTQGKDVSYDSWEEVCALGKNLWQILLDPPLRLPVATTSSSQTPQKSLPLPTSKSKSKSSTPIKNTVETSPPLGHFSHGTTYGFLASSDGAQFMESWRLSSPVELIKTVKAMLQAERERAVAEWEILQGDEWEEQRDEPKAQDSAAGGLSEQDERPSSVEETGILVRSTTQDPGQTIPSER